MFQKTFLSSEGCAGRIVPPVGAGYTPNVSPGSERVQTRCSAAEVRFGAPVSDTPGEQIVFKNLYLERKERFFVFLVRAAGYCKTTPAPAARHQLLVTAVPQVCSQCRAGCILVPCYKLFPIHAVVLLLMHQHSPPRPRLLLITATQKVPPWLHSLHLPGSRKTFLPCKVLIIRCRNRLIFPKSHASEA